MNSVIDRLNSFRIILASKSPRRRELLREMGLRFELAERDYDESYPKHLAGREIAEHIARKKADAFRGQTPADCIVITADTIVWCNNKLLGKPADYEDAVSILKEISGNTHDVITGVSVISGWKEVTFSEVTRVTFEIMTGDEIGFYAEKFRPFDKAGAYGIQEWIGIIGCSRIEGSYFNVVGLPVHRLYNELKKFID